MNRSILPPLLVPTCAYAGTSDPGGIASTILWVLVIGFGLWALVSVLIGRVVARSNLWRTLIAVCLAAAPLAYCGFNGHQFNSGLDDLRTKNAQLVLSANSYLAEKCGQERRYLSLRPVTSGDGVLIDVDPEQRLNLPDAPPPLKETARMREDQRRYGESYPVLTNKLQYERPVYWIRQMHADAVLVASRFAFVEELDRSSSGRPVRTTARKAWWLGPGQLQVIQSDKQELERRLANMPETDNYWNSQHVASSSAKYVFSLSDISTTEDRRNWVARAQIRLTEKDTGAVVAGYIGFAANQAPAYQPNESYPWERSVACPGREQNYQKDRMPWDVVGFFFREVVAYR